MTWKVRGLLRLVILNGHQYLSGVWLGVRAVLHLEAGPSPLEVDCMKFQPLLGWRSASTTDYNKIIMGANFPTCKGLRAKKLG